VDDPKMGGNSGPTLTSLTCLDPLHVLDIASEPRYPHRTGYLLIMSVKICLDFMPMKCGQIFEVSAKDP
jgi:hypothetical protein